MFAQWAEPWGRLGLWLSLWDEDAECIEHAGSACPFWHALMQHSEPFRQRLRVLARDALSGEGGLVSLDPQGGLAAIVLPVSHRQHASGAILACTMSGPLDEEVFARFCGQCQVDRLIFERLAADLPRPGRSIVQSYAEILQQHLAAYAEGTTARRDIGDLSSHLAQAYEELSLIYRVSSNLTVLKNPTEHFQHLCKELLQTTVVESFAAIIEPLESEPADSPPSVVRAGPLKVSSEDLIRLYCIAQTAQPNAGSALIVNDPCGSSEYAWASGWLKQFVYFGLASKEHQFGGLLAINHVDARQPGFTKGFGSEEVQLIHAVVERSSAFLENVRLYEDLEQLFMGMLHALVSSIDAKDPYTCGHAQRVAWFSRHIAELAGLSRAESHRVYLSGLLHDIGKIGVSESVLRKTGRLTEDEFKEMRQHPVIGARILENVRQVQDVIPGVLHHHERFDGKGYPLRLAGHDIPLFGRIIGLVDSFDAMTTSRTYRAACPVQIAEAEIRRCSGTQFDPELADLILGNGLNNLIRQMHESDKQPAVRPLLYSTDGGAKTLA